MTIDSEVSFLDSLKRRFAYHEWCDLKPAGENVFVDGYLVTGSELRGWHLHRVQTLEGPPPDERAGVLQVGRQWPGVTLSLWNSQVRTSDALVRVDTFECRSIEDSREVAVRLSANSNRPTSRGAWQPRPEKWHSPGPAMPHSCLRVAILSSSFATQAAPCWM